MVDETICETVDLRRINVILAVIVVWNRTNFIFKAVW